MIPDRTSVPGFKCPRLKLSPSLSYSSTRRLRSSSRRLPHPKPSQTQHWISNANMSTPRRHRLLSFNSEPGPNGHGAQSGLPMLAKPSTTRNNIVAALGEFVGTFLFLFFSFAGTQIANTGPPSDEAIPLPNSANLIFIALAFGLSLMANVWAFYRVTGGLFNPVVGRLLAWLPLLALMRLQRLTPRAGCHRLVSRGRSSSCPHHCRYHCSIPRRPGSGRRGLGALPRPDDRCDHARRRRKHSSGSLH